MIDAVTEAGVAARARRISDASFVRLRRARGRVICARILPENNKGKRDGSIPTGNEGERHMRTIVVAARGALELLARGWPDRYPAEAVE
ncbi:MAG: hypothetical protein CBCREVIR_0935 [Candidatus Burkholderia crenata]|nr:MAG: hypothetical protein CBCREVIR_0935 [Candidatus Burkholderia crenata]